MLCTGHNILSDRIKILTDLVRHGQWNKYRSVIVEPVHKSYTTFRYHLSPPQVFTSSYTEQHRQRILRKLEDDHFDATESVLRRRVTIISFIVVTSSSRAVVHQPAPTLMQKNEQSDAQRETTSRLRLAAAHVTGVQAGVAHGMLVAQPGEEALQTKTVATVGGRSVPARFLLVCVVS